MKATLHIIYSGYFPGGKKTRSENFTVRSWWPIFSFERKIQRLVGKARAIISERTVADPEVLGKYVSSKLSTWIEYDFGQTHEIIWLHDFPKGGEHGIDS